MAYPSNGENHHKAIKSEKNLFNYKSDLEKIWGKKIEMIEQLGGTKTKIDNIISFSDGTNKSLSLKSKKNIKTGSFDYVNTSSFDWSKFFPNTLSIYNNFKNSKNELNYKKLNQSISDELYDISSELITNLFIDNVINKYKDLILVIINEKTKSIYCDIIPPAFSLINNGGCLRIKKSEVSKVQTSYIIEGVNSIGDVIDIGLRIRVHLNNGKSMWLGNKPGTSNLVIKFQQDSVHKII